MLNKRGNISITQEWWAFVQPLLQWEINTYYTTWAWICSPRYPACNAHASYCHLRPASQCKNFFTISYKRHDFRKKKMLLDIKCVFRFSLQISSSSLHVSRWLVYSSAPLHLFIGRPRFLFPSGIPSCTFFTSRSSAILDTCSLHSVLLLCTQDVMFWISHNSRILSFRILSHFVLFIILLNVFISVTSSSCLVFAVSVRVSAA